MSDRTAFPEWLSRDDTAPEAWVVERGTSTRGDAWTDITHRRMRVPAGDDEVSRAVRAHEMVHAKVSPVMGVPPELAENMGVDPQALIVGEEFRVNMLAAAAGFDMDQLRDGSEQLAGELNARNGDWNAAVTFLCATAGTKAASDFLRGIGKHDKEMAKALRTVQTRLKKMWRDYESTHGIEGISSTSIRHDGTPRGFNIFTKPVAVYIDSLMTRQGDDGDKYSKAPSRLPGTDVLKGRGEKPMSFAKLIELKVPKPKHVDGKMGRKRTSSAIGKHPRRIDRMLTDPEKRIFDRRARAKGGIVLIDQSGSMHLNDDDIWRIIEHAPGCVIIGYSHEAGSTTVPNVWVIADRGRVADHVPRGGVGNGVDGPAIRFAAEHRKGKEPFIWVCDGSVTDGVGDMTDDVLDMECVDLIRKHGIHMVETVDECVEALKKAGKGMRLPTKTTGYRLTNMYRATAVS